MPSENQSCPLTSSGLSGPRGQGRAGGGGGGGGGARRVCSLLPAPASETQLPRPRPWIEGPQEPPLLSTRSPETLCKRQRQGRVSYRRGGRGGRGAPWRARHPGCTPNAGTGGRGLDPQCHRTHLPTTPAGARVMEGGMRRGPQGGPRRGRPITRGVASLWECRDTGRKGCLSPDGQASSQEPRRPCGGGYRLLVWPLFPHHRMRLSCTPLQGPTHRRNDGAGWGGWTTGRRPLDARSRPLPAGRHAHGSRARMRL